MWQYAPSEADYLQDFVDFSLAWLERYRYTLVIDVDMARWAAVMAQAMSEAAINPTFDPRFNALSPRNSFWLDIRSGSQTIASSAARFLITDDFLELIRSMRLWQQSPPADSNLTVVPPAAMPAIAGRIGHEGGLWVHPAHRKRGLSVILPHLNRALCFRQWDIDWQTGIARRAIGESGIATWAYGFPHVEPCFEGHFPLTRSQERLYITYMDRVELLAGLDLRTVSGLLADSDQQTLHQPARAQEG
jgi:hypothetical protein